MALIWSRLIDPCPFRTPRLVSGTMFVLLHSLAMFVAGLRTYVATRAVSPRCRPAVDPPVPLLLRNSCVDHRAAHSHREAKTDNKSKQGQCGGWNSVKIFPLIFPIIRHPRKTSPLYAAHHCTRRETKKTRKGLSRILLIRCS